MVTASGPKSKGVRGFNASIPLGSEIALSRTVWLAVFGVKAPAGQGSGTAGFLTSLCLRQVSANALRLSWLSVPLAKSHFNASRIQSGRSWNHRDKAAASIAMNSVNDSDGYTSHLSSQNSVPLGEAAHMEPWPG